MRELRDITDLVLDACGHAEAETGLAPYTPLDGPAMAAELTQCARGVGPVFLPLLYDAGPLIGVHVEPGESLADLGVVRFDHDMHGVSLCGRGIGRLPTVLFLWSHPSYLRQPDRSRWLAWLDALATRLPGGEQVPEALRHPRDPSILRQVWEPAPPGEDDPFAYTGHPFAGLWRPEPYSVELAARRLERFLSTNPPDPHLLALRAYTRAEAALPVTREDLEAFLGREYWYRFLGIGTGAYQDFGALSLWNSALFATARQGGLEVLRGSPLEPLIAAPDVFKCRRSDSVPVLLSVADNYRVAGDRMNELGTLRNAANAALLTQGDYPEGLLSRIVEVCEAVEPGGPATELTIEYVEAMKRSP